MGLTCLAGTAKEPPLALHNGHVNSVLLGSASQPRYATAMQGGTFIGRTKPRLRTRPFDCWKYYRQNDDQVLFLIHSIVRLTYTFWCQD